MKQINDFKNLKIGEWILGKVGKGQKEKVIITIEKNNAWVFSFNSEKNPSMIKIDWKKVILNELLDFFKPKWKFYKLNKREKKKYNKEIILGSL